MEPFKNLLGFEAAKKISVALKRAYSDFDSPLFLKGLKLELEPLELKDRCLAITQRLNKGLPKDRKKSLRILQNALKQDDADTVGLSGFLVWPLTQFVAQEGLKYFQESMQTLHAMTQVFTAEFAVRSYFIEYEKETLKQFEKWVHDPSEHVRRLVSEGSRPLLPWGQKLQSFVKDPERTWHLLEKLSLDTSKYVQKSVANHINDHSKNHPDWIINKLEHLKKKHPDHEGVEWIIRHGTRTLVKKGHPQALRLHGVEQKTVKILQAKVLSPQVKMGEKLKLEVSIQNTSKKKAKAIVDTELKLLRANGKYGTKVFKGKKLELDAGEKVKVLLDIKLIEVTTRSYYAGKQFLSVLVNGVPSQELNFILKK